MTGTGFYFYHSCLQCTHTFIFINEYDARKTWIFFEAIFISFLDLVWLPYFLTPKRWWLHCRPFLFWYLCVRAYANADCKFIYFNPTDLCLSLSPISVYLCSKWHWIETYNTHGIDLQAQKLTNHIKEYHSIPLHNSSMIFFFFHSQCLFCFYWNNV